MPWLLWYQDERCDEIGGKRQRQQKENNYGVVFLNMFYNNRVAIIYKQEKKNPNQLYTWS